MSPDMDGAADWTQGLHMNWDTHMHISFWPYLVTDLLQLAMLGLLPFRTQPPGRDRTGNATRALLYAATVATSCASVSCNSDGRAFSEAHDSGLVDEARPEVAVRRCLTKTECYPGERCVHGCFDSWCALECRQDLDCIGGEVCNCSGPGLCGLDLPGAERNICWPNMQPEGLDDRDGD